MLKNFINTLNLVKVMHHSLNHRFFTTLSKQKLKIFRTLSMLGLISISFAKTGYMLQSFKFKLKATYFKIKFFVKKSKNVTLSYKYLSRITRRYPSLIIVISSSRGISITPGYLSSRTGGRVIALMG